MIVPCLQPRTHTVLVKVTVPILFALTTTVVVVPLVLLIVFQYGYCYLFYAHSVLLWLAYKQLTLVGFTGQGLSHNPMYKPTPLKFKLNLIVSIHLKFKIK